MEVLLITIALLCYLVFPMGWLADDQRYPRIKRLTSGGIWAGLIVHGGALVLHSARLGAAPVHSPFESAATISFLVALGYLWARRTPRTQGLGNFLVPVVIVLLALSLLLPGDLGERPAQEWTFWFPIHVGMIFAGLSGFALSFGTSALYLLVRRQLKQKRLGALNRLPSLETLDGLNARFMLGGFSALTAGIAAGGIWAASLPDRLSGLGPTLYITLLVWAWYAVVVQIRVVGGWRGRLVATSSVVGFLGLVLTLLGVNAFLQGWHA